MRNANRREFLADVGKGMLIASVGPAVAYDLGLSHAFAADGPERLLFGKLEPMVALMQETPLNKLLPALLEKLQAGTDLRTLVAAGALANARAFGGQDYTGYHALMALAPAYQMAGELPEAQQALPVLKVLYRNTNRIHEKGGRKNEVLHPLEAADLPPDRMGGEALREATRRADTAGAERTFAALTREPVGEAFNHLQYAVQDEVDVHRVVLAWRSWVLLDFAGKDQALTLLRQSVRYCADSERYLLDRKRPQPAVRTALPKLLDQYRLLSKPLGARQGEDAWVEQLSARIYGSSREQAAEAVAAALAEGMAPEVVGEAISLAANQLVLHDPGRRQEHASAVKPAGSVHGDSVGVHASDAANAWRNIARVSNQRNTIASLIVGAFHTAGQSNGLNKESYPRPEHLEKISTKEAAALLRETEAAIKEKDQARACALVHRYGELDHPARPAFDLLLRFAVSEDGALHAEKYYRTVTEEFATTRAAFRWRQLAALARVTASEYGYPAPGYTRGAAAPESIGRLETTVLAEAVRWQVAKCVDLRTTTEKSIAPKTGVSAKRHRTKYNSGMRIFMACPAPPRSRKGNRVTALRWARLLRNLGHRPVIGFEYTGTPCDLMIALHARRSYEAIETYRTVYPRGPLVVMLTGTDLYRDIRTSRQARQSLHMADRLVVLQRCGRNELPAPCRRKTRVIYQSALPSRTRRPRRHAMFDVCVLGHLRHEKDPFRTALALRSLPAGSTVRVTHLGQALSPSMARRARLLQERDPRYRWLGEVPRRRARHILARSHLLVLSSRMEGGANVVSEALADGVPIVASRISGSVGILGQRYPGFFPVGDTGALAELLRRAEDDSSFYLRLKKWCAGLAPIVRPTRERQALKNLLSELSRPSIDGSRARR